MFQKTYSDWLSASYLRTRNAGNSIAQAPLNSFLNDARTNIKMPRQSPGYGGPHKWAPHSTWLCAKDHLSVLAEQGY